MKTELDTMGADGEPLEEAALREALAGEAPGPSEFLRGVRERIDARPAKPAPRLIARWRWAASILPPGIIPLVAASGTVSLKLSWKAVPGLIALPGIALVMVLLSFVGGIRSLRRLDDDGAGAKQGDDQREIAEWWKRNRKPTVIAIVAIVLMVFMGAPGAALMVVLGSMLAVVLLVGQLARVGLANRESVTKLCTGALSTLAWYWWILGDLMPDPLVGPPSRLLIVVPVIGFLLCGLVGGRFNLQSVWQWVLYPIRMRHPDQITVVCLRCLSIPVAVVAGGMLILGTMLVPLTLIPAGGAVEDQLLRAVESDIESGNRLDGLAITAARRLVDAGIEVPRPAASQLENLEWSLRSGIFREAPLDALALGWMPRDSFHYAALSAARRELLESKEPLGWSASLQYSSLYLLESGEALEVDRLAWVQRILDGWDVPAWWTLRDDQHVVDWLLALGATDAVAAEAPELRRRLQQHWKKLGSQRASFATFVGSEDWVSWAARLGQVEWSHNDNVPTLAGIMLMQQVGVPDGVDPRQLGRGVALQLQGWRQALGLVSREEARVLQLAQFELESDYPVLPRNVLEWLYELRLLLATLLLIAFALAAIRRAPVVATSVVEGERA